MQNRTNQLQHTHNLWESSKGLSRNSKRARHPILVRNVVAVLPPPPGPRVDCRLFFSPVFAHVLYSDCNRYPVLTTLTQFYFPCARILWYTCRSEQYARSDLSTSCRAPQTRTALHLEVHYPRDASLLAFPGPARRDLRFSTRAALPCICLFFALIDASTIALLVGNLRHMTTTNEERLLSYSIFLPVLA